MLGYARANVGALLASLCFTVLLSGCASGEALPKDGITIGPMIGNTTDTSFRVWARAAKAGAVGRVCYQGMPETNDQQNVWDSGETCVKHVPIVFQDAIYDYVGVADIKGLKPATSYVYRIELEGRSVSGQVRTFPVSKKAAASTSTRFIFGSCRDLAPYSSGGENTFKAIRAVLEKEPDELASDFIIQGGDQVYTDMVPLRKLMPGVSEAQAYWDVQHKAFSKPAYAHVMSRLPTYMIMDDHEVMNNWTGAKFDTCELPLSRKEIGLRSYMAYQAALNKGDDPAAAFNSDTYVNADESKYWYTFEHGASGFFVMDTRSDNDITKCLTDRAEGKVVSSKCNKQPYQEPKVIGHRQMAALQEWLMARNELPDSVKFIVSPVPVFPDTRDTWVPFVHGEPNDKWGGAVTQRRDLLEFIQKNHIRRVVFLSGDVHVSFVAELTSKSDPLFRVYNVVSSPFNWSITGGLGLQNFNFDFDFEPRPMSRPPLVDQEEGPASDYQVRRLFNDEGKPRLLHKMNNFARLTAQNGGVLVEFFNGHDGVLLETTTLTFPD